MNGLILDMTPQKVSTCKGQVFKGYSSFFYNNGRIERRQGIRLMKSLSCPGCEDCGGAWMLGEVREHIECETFLMPEIEHGKLYEIRVTNEERDWESGITDAYDLEVVPQEATCNTSAE